MASLATVIGTRLRPYWNYILAAFIFVIFVVVAIYAYRAFFTKKNDLKKYDDVANATDRKSVVEIIFFFVDWCPHCKTAKPEWDAFKRQYNGSTVNGNMIKCYDIDCTDDNGDQVITMDKNTATGITPTPVKTTELIKKYKINSYPTIICQKENDRIDFDAKITQVSLVKLINSV